MTIRIDFDIFLHVFGQMVISLTGTAYMICPFLLDRLISDLAIADIHTEANYESARQLGKPEDITGIACTLPSDVSTRLRTMYESEE